jgi:HEXXH motif-containing protein
MSPAPVDLPVGGDHEALGLVEMPGVLSWQSEGQEAARVQREYVLLLGERLGAVMASASDRGASAALAQRLAELPGPEWMRLVMAPRVSYRLLWPSRHDPDSVVTFLLGAAGVERSRVEASGARGRAVELPAGAASWSVLGDGWLGGDGSYVAGPGLEGFVPIDLGSPHALAIDLDGVTDEVAEARVPLSGPERDRILHVLGDVRDALASGMPDVLEFVVAFTKVLVLQPDPEAPTAFSTGSSAQYVGRSVFGNPHLGSVDAALLVEGLVHEATHSYMYMGERLEPWVTDAELYGPEQRTRSPWTGHPLPLRAYLQACFVWYGLVHFWGRAVGLGLFGPERARERLIQAARGFLRGDVLAQVEPYRGGIVPELLETIERVEAEVVAAVEAVGVAG